MNYQDTAQERWSGEPDPADLTPDEQEAARAQWRSSKCTWCGGLHLRACPRVKRMVFTNDGKTVTEVEYWPEGQWSADNIVWPEDMGWGESGESPTSQ